MAKASVLTGVARLAPLETADVVDEVPNVTAQGQDETS